MSDTSKFKAGQKVFISNYNELKPQEVIVRKSTPKSVVIQEYSWGHKKTDEPFNGIKWTKTGHDINRLFLTKKDFYINALRLATNALDLAKERVSSCEKSIVELKKLIESEP